MDNINRPTLLLREMEKKCANPAVGHQKQKQFQSIEEKPLLSQAYLDKTTIQ